jgi:hypothetical protein
VWALTEGNDDICLLWKRAIDLLFELFNAIAQTIL